MARVDNPESEFKWLGARLLRMPLFLIMAQKHCMASKRVARIKGKYARYLASKRVKPEQPPEEIVILRLA